MKKTSFQMSINRGKMTTNSRCPCQPCGNSLHSSLSLLVKSLKEEIQTSEDRVDIAKG